MGERQYRRVAVLSDVHGNAVALQKVLGELAEADAELVVFGGDLEGRPAYWALLGPDVELRRTPYALEDAAAAYRATSDPLAEQMVAMLEKPATREELVEHGEKLEFAS